VRRGRASRLLPAHRGPNDELPRVTSLGLVYERVGRNDVVVDVVPPTAAPRIVDFSRLTKGRAGDGRSQEHDGRAGRRMAALGGRRGSGARVARWLVSELMEAEVPELIDARRGERTSRASWSRGGARSRRCSAWSSRPTCAVSPPADVYSAQRPRQAGTPRLCKRPTPPHARLPRPPPVKEVMAYDLLASSVDSRRTAASVHMPLRMRHGAGQGFCRRRDVCRRA
jgi:hypothetical protein